MGDDVKYLRRKDQQGDKGWKHILETLVFNLFDIVTYQRIPKR